MQITNQNKTLHNRYTFSKLRTKIHHWPTRNAKTIILKPVVRVFLTTQLCNLHRAGTPVQWCRIEENGQIKQLNSKVNEFVLLFGHFLTGLEISSTIRL